MQRSRSPSRHTSQNTRVCTHTHTTIYRHMLICTHSHMHTHTHTCTLIYTDAQTHTHSHAHTQALTHRPDRGTCLPPACPTSRHRELQHSHLKALAAPLLNPQKADTAHCVTASLRSHREGGHDLSRLYINVRKQCTVLPARAHRCHSPG